MLSRALRCLFGLAITIGLIGPLSVPVTASPTMLALPAVAQTAGFYYAWTDYRTTDYGIQAQILVTDTTPSNGSGDFVSVSAVMPDGSWLQTGWVKGQTPIGNTNSNVMFYTEYCTKYYYGCSGDYLFTFQGVATVGTTHTFTVVYSGCRISCSAYYWYALIDGVSKASVALQQQTGVLEAQAESHNNLDHMPQGRFSVLQYYIPYGRAWRWFPWDGYGSHGAGPSFTQTIVSNTEWTYTEN